MASLNDTEKAALTSALSTTGTLPELKKKYFNAVLTGAFDAGSVNGALVPSTDKGYFNQVSVAGLAVSANSTTTLTTITIPAGVWRVTASSTWRTAGDGQIAVNTSASFPADYSLRGYGTVSTSLTGGSAHSPIRFFNVTADTTLYLMGNFSAAVASANALLTVERIQ
ncbi:hypothetical protein GJV14_03535 [Enterobacteriaceae bacterium RIT697]|uniref:hypothetical protein n=1 Tax=Pantoea sp. YR343 TaxID=1144341 RepID=UPI000270EFC6|nr:hypothetical protein [Pantoea sp. YR343]KAJ9432431.1 hypothetical protein PMI39_008860 [Pantoea sp. YR343]MRT23016.1 hypothetical protein [Enterobacteriaceae bacterium RIT697]